MKNFAGLCALLFVLTSCQQDKIAFVDNGEVINEYQEKKDLEEKYKGKDEVFKKKADSIGKAFQLEVQQTQLSASKASQKKAQELMGGLQQKQQVLQQQMQFEQQQLGQAFQSEMDSLIVKVKNNVKAYGKSNGYTFILGTSDAAASVLYGAEDKDLTKTILEALNASYKENK